MKTYGFLIGIMFSFFLYLKFTDTHLISALIVFLLLITLCAETVLNGKKDKIKPWALILSKMIIAYIASVSFCFLLIDNSIFKEKIIRILIFSFVPSIITNLTFWIGRKR